jgi:hypothetical protein
VRIHSCLWYSRPDQRTIDEKERKRDQIRRSLHTRALVGSTNILPFYPIVPRGWEFSLLRGALQVACKCPCQPRGCGLARLFSSAPWRAGTLSSNFHLRLLSASPPTDFGSRCRETTTTTIIMSCAGTTSPSTCGHGVTAPTQTISRSNA